MGCDPSPGFYKEEIHFGSNGITNDNSLESERIMIFFFKMHIVRIDKNFDEKIIMTMKKQVK